METIRLDPAGVLDPADVDPLEGTFLDDSSWDVLVDRDLRVERPDGTPLLIFLRGVLPADECRAAYPALRRVARKTRNRGAASGRPDADTIEGRAVGKRMRFKFYPINRDGTLSKTKYARSAESGVLGYMDRSARYPYCRLTAFALSRPDAFAAALPWIRSVDRAFRDALPERYAAQAARVRETSADFVIHGTAFTTLTVNRNFRTAVHQDRGDLREGFGVMSVLRAGHYRGGLLCFPRWRVAVDMRTRDVLLADVHEWHGNTPIVAVGPYERIACVFYYRRQMNLCGTAPQELERAKRRRQGDPIRDRLGGPPGGPLEGGSSPSEASPLVVGVGGEPGTGKSRLVARVLAALGPGRGFSYGTVRGTLHGPPGRPVLVLGRYRGTPGDPAGRHPGTDRLSMAAQRDAEALVAAVADGRVPARAVLFEGDRLFSGSFLEACWANLPGSRFVVLEADAATLAGRRAARGDRHTPGFLRGRATKYARLLARFPGRIERATLPTDADADALARRLIDAMGAAEGG